MRSPVSGGPLSGGLVGWRLDHARFASTWDSGEGAFRVGGRWNSKGVRAVYACLDAATAILEVAVHKGFRTLDVVPHVMTSFEIVDPALAYVVDVADVPNPNWLRPGTPSAGQQMFGDDLISRHAFVVIPSVVSANSWNMVFDPLRARGAYSLRTQAAFALDTRLHPPQG